MAYLIRRNKQVFFCPTKMQAGAGLSGRGAGRTGNAPMWRGFPPIDEGGCIEVHLVLDSVLATLPHEVQCAIRNNEPMEQNE